MHRREIIENIPPQIHTPPWRDGRSSDEAQALQVVLEVSRRAVVREQVGAVDGSTNFHWRDLVMLHGPLDP